MSAAAAVRRLLAKERRGEAITVHDALAACPFRTPLGRAGQTSHDATHAQLADALLNNVTSVIALIEDRPSPIGPETMGAIQTDLASGQTVLLLASCREVRDHARWEILAWGNAPRGTA
jgi:hypothetical protein